MINMLDKVYYNMLQNLKNREFIINYITRAIITMFYVCFFGGVIDKGIPLGIKIRTIVLVILVIFTLFIKDLLPAKVPEIMYVLPVNKKERKQYLKTLMLFKLVVPSVLSGAVLSGFCIGGQIDIKDLLILELLFIIWLLPMAISGIEEYGNHDTFASIFFIFTMIAGNELLKDARANELRMDVLIVLSIIFVLAYSFYVIHGIKLYKELMRKVEGYELDS